MIFTSLARRWAHLRCGGWFASNSALVSNAYQLPSWVSASTCMEYRNHRTCLSREMGRSLSDSVPSDDSAGGSTLTYHLNDGAGDPWLPRSVRVFRVAADLIEVPQSVTTDKAGPYLRVINDLAPAAAHITEQYSNNRIEADHARLKARLRPMRGLKQFRSAARIAAGHALVQNLRRGHYELATDAAPPRRLATAFSELGLTM